MLFQAIFPEGHDYRWEGRRKIALYFCIRINAVLAAIVIYYCTIQIDMNDEVN